VLAVVAEGEEGIYDQDPFRYVFDVFLIAQTYVETILAGAMSVL